MKTEKRKWIREGEPKITRKVHREDDEHIIIQETKVVTYTRLVIIEK